jgi:hypothetical protein
MLVNTLLYWSTHHDPLLGQNVSNKWPGFVGHMSLWYCYKVYSHSMETGPCLLEHWTRDLIHLTCVTSSTSTTLVHPTKQINSVERFNESCTHSRVAFGHGRLFWLVLVHPTTSTPTSHSK